MVLFKAGLNISDGYEAFFGVIVSLKPRASKILTRESNLGLRSPEKIR